MWVSFDVGCEDVGKFVDAFLFLQPTLSLANDEHVLLFRVMFLHPGDNEEGNGGTSVFKAKAIHIIECGLSIKLSDDIDGVPETFKLLLLDNILDRECCFN
jgi:hypothetical protein